MYVSMCMWTHSVELGVSKPLVPGYPPSIGALCLLLGRCAGLSRAQVEEEGEEQANTNYPQGHPLCVCVCVCVCVTPIIIAGVNLAQNVRYSFYV